MAGSQMLIREAFVTTKNTTLQGLYNAASSVATRFVSQFEIEDLVVYVDVRPPGRSITGCLRSEADTYIQDAPEELEEPAPRGRFHLIIQSSSSTTIKQLKLNLPAK